MVSEFLSELAGRCDAPRPNEEYAQTSSSVIAKKVASGFDSCGGIEARLILERALRGKDKYFDNEQLIAQSELAMEVFAR